MVDARSQLAEIRHRRPRPAKGERLSNVRTFRKVCFGSLRATATATERIAADSGGLAAGLLRSRRVPGATVGTV